jgi:hypothetical protein
MPGKCNWFSLVGIGITTKMFPIWFLDLLEDSTI